MSEVKQEELTFKAKDTDANGKPDDWEFSIKGKVSVAIISFVLGFGSCYLIFVGV